MSTPPQTVQSSPSGLLRFLETMQSRRVLVLTGPSHRHAEVLAELSKRFEVSHFPFAVQHVPMPTVERAFAQLDSHQADTVVAIGGGAATGLGKALRLRTDFHFIVVPTTFAGSEFTNIYGMTDGPHKVTGRDGRVLPDLIVQDVQLLVSLPPQLAMASLLNALAHPLSALSVGPAWPLSEAALDSAQLTYQALNQVSHAGLTVDSVHYAMRAARYGAELLMHGEFGEQHRLVHALGGRFNLPHGPLHAVLLPHTLALTRLREPNLYRQLCQRLRHSDPESQIFDLAEKAGCKTALSEMGVTHSELSAFLTSHPELSAEVVLGAYHGQRPSSAFDPLDWEGLPGTLIAGVPVKKARRLVVALHGRGSNATSALSQLLEILGAEALAVNQLSLVAPQAPDNRWYSHRHFEARQVLGDALEQAVRQVLSLLDFLRVGAPKAQLVLFGFSQGACLGLEVLARHDGSLSAAICLSGSGIGGHEEPPSFPSPQGSSKVLLGSSERDPWVSVDQVEATRDQLQRAGFKVDCVFVPGSAHAIAPVHAKLARRILCGSSSTQGDS